MTSPGDAMTQPIEAKKDGLAQLQDGCWTLKLKVHLNDMPTWLMSAPMGTRLACAIVEIGDDEKPVPHEKDELSPAKKAYAAKSEGEQAVVRAAVYCGERAFQKYLMTQYYSMPDVLERNNIEEITISHLRAACGNLISRADLATNSHALSKFLAIEATYREATGQVTESR